MVAVKREPGRRLNCNLACTVGNLVWDITQMSAVSHKVGSRGIYYILLTCNQNIRSFSDTFLLYQLHVSNQIYCLPTENPDISNVLANMFTNY